MKKILLFSSLIIFLNSCSDIKTGGCIDPYASNYDTFADYDDGSCEYIMGCTDPLANNYDPQAGLEPLNGCDYSCEIVWYLTPSAGEFMLEWGIDYYYFFLQNENLSFGSIGNNWIWDSPPDCQYQTDGSTLVQTFYWSGNYDNFEAIVEWEAWADDGTTILILDYEGADIVYPNECISIGLTATKIKDYQQTHKNRKTKEKIK